MLTNKIVLVDLLRGAVSDFRGCSRQQSDWQKTRESQYPEAYEQFLKKYPSGEFTAQAQARVKELYEERDWQKARDADTPEAYQAFLKQYPEGKWTEEARIGVENFTLAQTPARRRVRRAPRRTRLEPARRWGRVRAPSDRRPQRSPPAPPAPPAQQHAGGAAPPSKVGSYGIQLGAFKSGAAAAEQALGSLAEGISESCSRVCHRRWCRRRRRRGTALSPAGIRRDREAMPAQSARI